MVDAKLDVRSRSGIVEARFRSDPAVRAELEALISAERECCAFFRFELRETGTTLALTITSLNPADADDLGILAPALGIAP